MQQAFLPEDMPNFNQKNIKIIPNSALVKAKPETFFRSEGNFQYLD